MILKILVLVVAVCGVRPQCYTEQGEQVDWFVMFKMPDGYTYLYADAENEQLVSGKSELGNQNNPVARTLNPVYNEDNSNWFMYNDQAPDARPVSNRGHTKGVVLWNRDTVTWLVHSAPHFPPRHDDGYSYPESSARYGQSFLCFSVPVSSLPVIAHQLLYSWPKIYEYQVDDDYREKYEVLDMVLRSKHVQEDPWFSVVTFNVSEKMTLTSFTKFTYFDDDLYKALVGPTFGINMYAETWQNGRDPLPSDCSGDLFVKNIEEMELKGVNYSESKDHSKWALSADSQKPYVCIGGINRMLAQTKRGGGTFCMTSKTLWSNMMQGIVKVEECEDRII